MRARFPQWQAARSASASSLLRPFILAMQLARRNICLASLIITIVTNYRGRPTLRGEQILNISTTGGASLPVPTGAFCQQHMWDSRGMTVTNLPRPNEQRKVEKLLVKLAKIKYSTRRVRKSAGRDRPSGSHLAGSHLARLGGGRQGKIFNA
jgi:hypothetical protein